MRFCGLLGLVLALVIGLRPALPEEPKRATLRTIENGSIRVGVDLDRGGSIGTLADCKSNSSVVNIHDLGRWIGQSYYAGPKPFGEAHPAWEDWPWNPVSAGSVYNDASKILEVKHEKQSIYIKSQPMQWALKRTLAECTFETWITLHERTVQVRNRLTNTRSDTKQYPAMDQELPALYTIGSLHKLMTYSGDAPFSDAKITEIPKKPLLNGKPNWNSFRATEHWAALVNDDDFGLGIHHAGVVRFLGGFAGKEHRGGPNDDATGYLSPIRQEILDADIAYEYRYTLILDSLVNIRKYAIQQKPKVRVPDYRFTNDRQHWWLVNASDGGPKLGGTWHVKLENDDPQLIGPESFWLAEDAPKFVIRCAHTTAEKNAEVYFRCFGQTGFTAEQKISWQVANDGKFHSYELDLSKHAKYRGAITQLRFDPVASGKPGEFIMVESITTASE